MRYRTNGYLFGRTASTSETINSAGEEKDGRKRRIRREKRRGGRETEGTVREKGLKNRETRGVRVEAGEKEQGQHRQTSNPISANIRCCQTRKILGRMTITPTRPHIYDYGKRHFFCPPCDTGPAPHPVSAERLPRAFSRELSMHGVKPSRLSC